MQTVEIGLSPGLWNEKRNNGSGKNQAGDATDEEFVEKAVERKDRKSMAQGDDPWLIIFVLCAV